MKMKRKVLTNFFRIILLAIMLSAVISNFVFAEDIVDALTDPSKGDPEGELIQVVKPILSIIQVVSIGAAVGLIISDGIKLLTTTDNSEKANLKRKILYYLIGGIFIFAPVTVIKVLSNTAENIMT